MFQRTKNTTDTNTRRPSSKDKQINSGWTCFNRRV